VGIRKRLPEERLEGGSSKLIHAGVRTRSLIKIDFRAVFGPKRANLSIPWGQEKILIKGTKCPPIPTYTEGQSKIDSAKPENGRKCLKDSEGKANLKSGQGPGDCRRNRGLELK